MATAVAVTPTREIVCPGCGRIRLVSERNARRAPQNCMLCRNPGKRKDPDDKDRRFWLSRFSDQEICEMAIGIANAAEEHFDVAMVEVRMWRYRLIEQNGKAA